MTISFILKNASDSTTMTMRKSDLTFLNGAWRVSVLDGKNIPADAEMQMVIDLPELKVHGNTGCNILNGSIFVDPAKQNSLQFSNLATTRMACPDMEREQKFLVALEQVETAIPGKDKNTALLKDDQGQVMMQLTRLNLPKQ